MSFGKVKRKGNIVSKLFLVTIFLSAIIWAGQATCFATNVTLQWDTGTDSSVTGYKVYYQADSSVQPLKGTGATNGASPVDVQNLTSATISGLDPSHAYYFAVTAYNASGTESSYSNLVTVPESVPPTVSIASPANNATASGTVSITANATDNVGVTKVEFYVNGVLQTTDTSTPYIYSWNTSALAAGTYTLMAKAYDAAGNVGQSSIISVSVVNDTTPPTVSLTAPGNNATVSGTVAITASAGDNVGVSKVEFYGNGVLLTATNVAPYSYNWNTASVANGGYTLTAKAYDAAGNVGQSANVTVTVNNATTPTSGAYTAVFGNASGTNYPNTVEDTFLQINTTVNATSTLLNTYTWPANKPANAILMKWNISALPANARIQSATLSLYMTGSGGDALYEIPVSEVINKLPVIAKSNGKTYDGVNAWTASSVPNGGIPLAQSDIAPAVDAPLVDKTVGYKNWNVTSIVKDWVATPGNNKGLLLDSSSKASVDSNRVFASSEAVDANQRPKLVITYTLASDTTAPTVAISAPVSSTTVSGTVAVNVTASDNIGVTKVEFYVNGSLMATDAASPYSFSWNTASAANGSYTLTAKAYDAAGNIGQSANITVTVTNTTTPASGTYTAVFGNASGANYPNTIEDTFLQINTSVNASSTVLNTYTWPANKPANAILMKWNISALPANARIQSATLSLYMTGSGGDALYEIPVSEVINKLPVIAKSTGKTYDGVNAWTASNVPYGGIPLAQSDIAPAVTAPQIDTTPGYKSWDVTSIVKDWLATPGNNKGLLLDSSSKASADSNRVFASSEAVDANQRPKLVVTYVLP